MEATKVIDVSHHQGTIDWEQVKNAGIAGVIIRCGYGMDQASQDEGSGRGMPMPARDSGFPSERISILTPTASRRRQAKRSTRSGCWLDTGFPIRYIMI